MTSLTHVELTLAYLAEQPIIHTEETLGNIAKIKKLRVMAGQKPIALPALSGNSFRGQLRDLLADRMFEGLSNRGEQRLTFTNNEIYGAIYCGGALREQSRLAGTMHTLQQTIPMLRLMGAAFGNVMLPSKLAATHIVPCAKETRGVLASAVSELGEGVLPPETEWPMARDLVFNDGPLTRKDDLRDPARQRFTQLSEPSQDDSQQPQQMIYYVECIPPGTWLLQQLYSKYALDDLELGCLFDGLSAWLPRASLGGRSAAGYGQVCVYVRGQVGDETVAWARGAEWPEPVKNAIGKYRTALETKRNDILSALQVKEAGNGQTEGGS